MMRRNEVSEALLAYLHELYETASTALDFSNDYQCVVAISLSAQTTDKSVNKVTPTLFKDFPDFESLGQGPIEKIEGDIKSLGLYHNKAKNLLALGKEVSKKYGGLLPHDRKKLEELPGVGSKTAAVFLLERSEQAFLPVDTHIKRIAFRLNYCKEDESPLSIEKKLEANFPKDEWKYLHHALIYFGRNICQAQNPACASCKLQGYCRYFKRNFSTKGK